MDYKDMAAHWYDKICEEALCRWGDDYAKVIADMPDASSCPRSFLEWWSSTEGKRVRALCSAPTTGL